MKLTTLFLLPAIAIAPFVKCSPVIEKSWYVDWRLYNLSDSTAVTVSLETELWVEARYRIDVPTDSFAGNGVYCAELYSHNVDEQELRWYSEPIIHVSMWYDSTVVLKEEIPFDEMGFTEGTCSWCPQATVDDVSHKSFYVRIR